MKTGTPVHITTTHMHGTITHTHQGRNTVRLTDGSVRYYDDNELLTRYTTQSHTYARKPTKPTVDYPDGTYISA